MSTKDKEEPSTTTEIISKDESQEIKKKEQSNSSLQKKEKENDEEEEEEIEVEEEVEEKDDDEEESEDEKKDEKETEAIVTTLPEKSKDGLEVSMELIKKFKDISIEESDEGICEYIKDKGLPMEVKDEQTLALILYFHKLCVPFFKILNSLKKKNIQKIFLSSLKESYFLFADENIKHYNYKSIAKKVFPNLKKSQEEFLISVEFNNSSLSDPIVPTPSVFKINQKILELGLESQGKLDIYSKIHILKSLINFINLEKLIPYTKDFQQMENDLVKLYKNSQKEKMTEEKYNEYVQIFTNTEKREECFKIISSCKKAISIFQNINDLESIKIYEKLFIQLLGHFDRDVRNEAVKVLNIIYDQTTWQEKSPFPLGNTNVKLIGEELHLELVVDNSVYSDKSVVLVCSTPCNSKNINYTVTSFIKSTSEKEEDDSIVLTFNLGKLAKCGYYDW